MKNIFKGYYPTLLLKGLKNDIRLSFGFVRIKLLSVNSVYSYMESILLLCNKDFKRIKGWILGFVNIYLTFNSESNLRRI